VVLIDSPPLLPVTDAAVLSNRVDATLLVTRAGVTSRRELGRAIELLHQVDAPLVGTVLNGVGDESAYGYAYNYRYYSSDKEPGGRPIVAPDKL
jgi:Mrp family chromosome partitioning ATPase